MREPPKLADDVAQKKRPFDTLGAIRRGAAGQGARLNSIRGSPSKAIDLLDSALVYARANSGVLYVRGNAYLKAGRGSDAVQAFQRLLDWKEPAQRRSHHAAGQGGPGPWLMSSQEIGACSSGLSGFLRGVEKMRTPDIPALREVKAEYAKLQ